MLDRRLRKLGTLLGLFAIWLTVLAPTISQTLAVHAEDAHGDAGLVIECPTHAMAGMPAPPVHGDTTQRHDALGHLQACGYCAFFAHLPMVSHVAPVLVSAFTAAAVPYTAAFTTPSRAERFRVAQPRAPPVVS